MTRCLEVILRNRTLLPETFLQTAVHGVTQFHLPDKSTPVDKALQSHAPERPCWEGFCLVSYTYVPMTVSRMKALLVPQSFDGIKIGGFSGGVIAKADSH